MRHLDVDYYVGWLSAAELHGASHQAPQVFQVATGRHVRSRRIGRSRFTFLERDSVRDRPVVEQQTRSGTARVATPELTVLDIAADLDAAGGIDNAATVIAELADQSRLDVEALAQAAELFAATVGRRAGWFLDRFAPGVDLEPLREAVYARTTSPSLLDPTGPHEGGLDTRWRLRINREVEEESW
nr:type IV toxin-antitoxin system AbiEi family antitoxin [Jiangella mangrovi]